MANGQATQPTTQPTPQPTAPAGGIQWTPNPALQTQPTGQATDNTPPTGGIQWTPNPDSESQTQQDQNGDFSPEALAKHPVLTQLHRGFETGFQHGLGLN